MKNVAVIGSGPAGYTAAIYTSRANLEPVVFTGVQAGGQLTTTTEVENFPGFPEGITGPELMNRLVQQATRFGTTVKMGCRVQKVEQIEGGFELTWEDMYQGKTESEQFRTVIIATGASARYLGLPGEADFLDGSGQKSGLTACAVCDGAMPTYRDQPVIVVGGGDSACEEAQFMTKFASKVYLAHRRDQLRASKVMADRALANDKIEPLWHTVLTGYKTDDNGAMVGVEIENLQTGDKSDLPVKGVFMAIGHIPNTGFLEGTGVELEDDGYVKIENGCQTSIPGIFAAGDVRDSTYRQAISAAGLGCMAALEAERYIEDLHG
jgi:thioredoxin reductase (NADPH)